MVLVQGSKLSLPYPSLSSPQTTSLLFEPNSLSLALMHSDSTFSLYPSLSSSPLSLSSLPPPQTLIHPPSSSSTFLLLQNPNPNPNPNPRTLFIVSGPYKGGSQILLRFYILHKTQFVRAKVICSQKDLNFDHKLGVLVDCNHGVSIKLSGSVNFFAMYSVSSSKIWVFAVKDVGVGGGGDGVALKLMRCAVIDCCKVVWSISVSFGFLILGEDDGVRVVNLRQLVKGKVRKAKSSNSSLKLGLPDGVVGDIVHCEAGKCNGYLCRKSDGNYVSVKQRSVKLKQDSCEDTVCFAAFQGKELETSKSGRRIPVKAISIDALSPHRFLILDSDGGLQILHLSIPVIGSNITTFMQQLPNAMKVQKVAVLPETAARTQSVWVSDGYNSVQMMVASDMDGAVNEEDLNESKDKPMHITVGLTIFTGEKIQDLTPLAANTILILGQGNLYSYATS